MPRRKIPSYQPKPQELCLCGSGLVFSACCSARLPGFDHGDRVREIWNSGDYANALLAARAALCQYAIWHKSHTAPVIGNPKIEKLLATDIEALSHYVGDICGLYFRLDREGELPLVLERLRGLVADARWHRKITYHQALLLDASGDEEGAKAEFRKLGPIAADREADVEILQAHLDVCGEDLSFAEKIAVCDRILAITRSTSDRIQYGVVKAMAYAGIDDLGEARKLLAYTVAHGHMKAREKELSLRTQMLFAGCLSFLGLLSRQEKHFVEAEALFKGLIGQQENYTAAGRAMLLDNLGECYRYWGKWTDADHAYRESIHLDPKAIRSVFLAECEFQLGRKDTAGTILDEVPFDELTSVEQVDLAYVQAELAVDMQDRARLKAAQVLLEQVKTREPHFEQRRLSFIIQVQDALATGPGSALWLALKDVFVQPLRKLNRYVLFQPNIAGMGLNINAMIEDGLGPKDKDSDK